MERIENRLISGWINRHSTDPSKNNGPYHLINSYHLQYIRFFLNGHLLNRILTPLNPEGLESIPPMEYQTKVLHKGQPAWLPPVGEGDKQARGHDAEDGGKQGGRPLKGEGYCVP